MTRVPFVRELAGWLATRLGLPALSGRLDAVEASLAARQAEATSSAVDAGRLAQELDDTKHSMATLAARLATLESRQAELDNPPVDDATLRFASYYHTFEEHFRGSRDEIRERLRFYLPLLMAVHEATPKDSGARFIDLGCGRGEMVELLRDQGVDAYGVESSASMLSTCRERGLPVVQDDVVAHIAGQAESSVAGVTCIHVAEHLPPPALVKLCAETFRALRPGGVAVFETPNPENLIVGACNFYYDFTHVRPLPPEPMRFMLVAAGFTDVAIERLHPGATVDAIERAEDAVAKLYTTIMNVPQDYALIAYKPAPSSQPPSP